MTTPIAESIIRAQNSKKTSYSQYTSRELGSYRLSTVGNRIQSRFLDYDDDSRLETNLPDPLVKRKNQEYYEDEYGSLTQMYYEIKKYNEDNSKLVEEMIKEDS